MKLPIPIQPKERMNLDIITLNQFIKQTNWIESTSSHQYKIIPEYPNDFRSMFGLIPASYMYLSDVCLKRKKFSILRNFLIKEGFSQHEEGFSSYKYVHFSKKIIIFGDIDDSNDDIDNETELLIHFCPLEENKEFLNSLIKILKKCLVKKIIRENNFFMVAQSDRGLYNHETKFKPIPIKDNRYDLFYGKEFPHDKITKFVTDETDNLLLLHGDPGTRKSNYIKHLIHSSKRKVIYIPPSMLSVIASPSFISYIMDNAGSLLLIEDAEEVLSCDRNAATNNLLGLTDGFLKDCLDLKVICTFNCDFGKIDPALTRKGRMYLEYKFDKLSVEESKELAEFMDLNVNITGPMSLADIFNVEQNSFSDSFETRRMGFC